MIFPLFLVVVKLFVLDEQDSKQTDAQIALRNAACCREPRNKTNDFVI